MNSRHRQTPVLLAAIAAGCALASAFPGEQNAKRPKLGPLPNKVPAPKDNPTTPAKVSLGKQLFFDKRLSGDNAMSCATCHLPDKGLADGLARGKGRRGRKLDRNTPGLWNVGHFTRYFWDGRASSLEEQALAPIRSPDEMNQDLKGLVDELNAIPGYVRQFQKVFGTKATRAGIARALAAFERTLVTEPSPVDRYLAGDRTALSAAARRGLELFRRDAGCIRCHNGPLLSDGRFYRLGVSFKDKGLSAVTGKRGDVYKFRTPTLRNVAETAPYMHDGSLATLSDVVTFYYRNVPPEGPKGLKLDVKARLDGSVAEIGDLVEFLKALSGKPPKITPPRLP